MKCNNQGDFCMLYLEAADTRSDLLHVLAGQKKPVVIMPGDQSRLFQRPEDFTDLKHARRQLDLSIIFIIHHSERLAQLASRNGFPVYASMDALASALAVGQQVRHRVHTRPLTPPATSGPLAA